VHSPARFSLARITAPAAALLTLQEAKDHVRVDSTAEDTLITALIAAATDAIEGYLQRALITQRWRYSIDRFPYACASRSWERPSSSISPLDAIALPRPNLLAVVSLTYLDLNGQQQTLDPATYVADLDGTPGAISLAYNRSWPNAIAQRNAIVITYDAGYGANAASVPGAIVAAAKLVLADLYANREASLAGTIAENPTVRALLGQYCHRES
jgi:uncharacterized phiE125 gp8 family phage protein